MLGRKLKKDEDVHHRNKNRMDFSRRNLKILDHWHHGYVTALQHFYMEHIRDNQERDWYESFELFTGGVDNVHVVDDSICNDNIGSTTFP
jgi:hypothetical protein